MAITNWAFNDLTFWQAVNETLDVTGNPPASFLEMRKHFEARAAEASPVDKSRPKRALTPLKVAASIADDRYAMGLPADEAVAFRKE